MPLTLAVANGTSIDLDYLRANYSRAVTDKTLCNRMITDLRQSNRSAVAGAYYGALLCVRAKHSLNPMQKLQSFNAGKAALEAAVARVPKNVEVRFLRLSIQQNIPRFLNYRSDVDEDRRYLAAHMHKITSVELKSMILAALTDDYKPVQDR
ncbi:MAG: hypothetical protein EAS48_07550 [Chryseobacterium sp.]|nr:MAG: hypothetical protein EAS48_07550 [Chryseobacterium sp.]